MLLLILISALACSAKYLFYSFLQDAAHKQRQRLSHTLKIHIELFWELFLICFCLLFFKITKYRTLIVLHISCTGRKNAGYFAEIRTLGNPDTVVNLKL